MNLFKNYKLGLLSLFFLYGNLIISEDYREINTDKYNNLWSIGIELKEIYIDYSVYQIMISLLELNESAFKNGNINSLKKGFVLNLPEESDLEKLDALSSIREVARQNLAANVEPIDFSVLTDVLVLSEPTFMLSKDNEDASLILDEIDIDLASSEESSNKQNRKTLITYSLESDPDSDSSEKIIVVNLSGSNDKNMTNLSTADGFSSISDEIDLPDNEESLISFDEPDEIVELDQDLESFSSISDEIDLPDNEESLISFDEPDEIVELDQNSDQIKVLDIPKFEIVSEDLTTIEKSLEKTTYRDFLRTEFYLLFGFVLLLVFLSIFRIRPAKKEKKTLKNDEELKGDLDEEFGEIGDPIEARINLAITYIEMNQIDKANDLLSQVLESEATEDQKEKARNLIKDI
jgi:FimV-like protein